MKTTLPRNLLSAKLPTNKHYTNKAVLSDSEDNCKLRYSKSHSFKIERAVKLNEDADTRTGKDCPELLSEQMEGLSIQVTKNVVDEVIHEKYSKATRPPAPTPRRSSSTPRRRLQPSKTFHARTVHKEV
jgi:NIMA (never in mitosis gene a)-related kinase